MSYDTKSLAHVKMDDDTYRVFEHPSGDHIMITTSLGAAAGQGFVKGATFGLADASRRLNKSTKPLRVAIWIRPVECLQDSQ
jgi:hypothetical protein